MRILSFGNFGRSWDGSICDEEHIACALEKLGHEVTRCQRDSWTDVGFEDYDFALIAQWNGYLEDFMANVKNFVKGPVVYWAFDYQADGQEWHERLIQGADVYLSKRIADSKYSNWQWLPQDFAPESLYRAFLMDDKDIDVLFTGSYLPWAIERTELLKAIDERFNLVVHSFTPDAWRAQGLKNVNGPVMDDDLPALICRAKINVSIDHTIEAGYWSDRNAQIMVCGGFVLFRYVPLSESIFHDKVAYFYNTEDCLEKIQYYLDDEFKREHMAEVGRAYAEHNMMVINRVQELLTIVKAYL